MDRRRFHRGGHCGGHGFADLRLCDGQLQPEGRRRGRAAGSVHQTERNRPQGAAGLFRQSGRDLSAGRPLHRVRGGARRPARAVPFRRKVQGVPGLLAFRRHGRRRHHRAGRGRQHGGH